MLSLGVGNVSSSERVRIETSTHHSDSGNIPGCTRSSERVRIETHKFLPVEQGKPCCTRSSERVRIETVPLGLSVLLFPGLHPLFGAGED